MQTRIGNLRWGIAILLGVGIVINYIDRVNISVASSPLISEYHLTKTDLGIILSSFLWSYAILQIPVGMLLDRIGVKWLMRIGTLLWGYMKDTKQTETKRFSLYSPPEILERLRSVAVKNRRSLNSEMLEAIEQYLKQHEQKETISA